MVFQLFGIAFFSCDHWECSSFLLYSSLRSFHFFKFKECIGFRSETLDFDQKSEILGFLLIEFEILGVSSKKVWNSGF